MKDKKNLVLFLVCMATITIAYFIISLLFTYEDTVSFTAWSVSFWDVFPDLSNYYAYCTENARGSLCIGPEGSWLTFFPWIIWNLPLKILHPVATGEIMNSIRYIAWSKLMLIVFLAVLCYFVYKIVVLLSNDKKMGMWAIILTSGSMELLDSIGFAGQDEIVYLTFFTMALYMRMINKKVPYLIFATMAVTVCPIMLIPLCFVELVYEKKIYWIFMRLICTVIPTLIFGIVYKNDSLYQMLKAGNTIGMFQNMMISSSIDIIIGRTSIPVTLLVIMALKAYFSKKEEDKNQSVIKYLGFCFFLLSFLMSATWYRFCIYIPIFVIYILMSKNSVNLKVFLFSVMGLFRFIISLAWSYNMNTKYFSPFVKTLIGSDTMNGMIFPMQSIALDSAIYVMRPIALGFAIAILYLAWTLNKKDVEFELPAIGTIAAYSCIPLVLAGYLMIVAMSFH